MTFGAGNHRRIDESKWEVVVPGDKFTYTAHVVFSAIKGQSTFVDITEEIDENTWIKTLFDQIRDLSTCRGW